MLGWSRRPLGLGKSESGESSKRPAEALEAIARNSVSLPKTLEMGRYWRVFDMIPRRHAGFMGHLLPTSGFTLMAKLMMSHQHPVTTFSPHSFNTDHLGSGCHHFSAKALIQDHQGLYLVKVCINAQSSYFPTSQQQLTWLQPCSLDSAIPDSSLVFFLLHRLVPQNSYL